MELFFPGLLNNFENLTFHGLRPAAFASMRIIFIPYTTLTICYHNRVLKFAFPLSLLNRRRGALQGRRRLLQCDTKQSGLSSAGKRCHSDVPGAPPGLRPANVTTPGGIGTASGNDSRLSRLTLSNGYRIGGMAGEGWHPLRSKYFIHVNVFSANPKIQNYPVNGKFTSNTAAALRQEYSLPAR